jgi:hypothetical protein
MDRPAELISGFCLCSVDTPCNAATFGEMKGSSLFRMLVPGLLLNLSGALLTSIWLAFIIPLIYP